jgi:hypothetical protein
VPRARCLGRRRRLRDDSVARHIEQETALERGLDLALAIGLIDVG